jgi:tetratricopeptide (TPR) repeat protein
MLEAKEDGAVLRQAIEELPGSLREALVLYYYHDQSHAETAARLGISPAAVQVRVARARRRLRDSIAAEIERRLPETAPGDDFAKRTLAAIPVGSICGKLGLNVMRVGLMEAVRELTQSAAQHASTIVSGGMTMTAKKTVGTAIVLALLTIGGAGYLILQSRGGGRAQATSAVGPSRVEGNVGEGTAAHPAQTERKKMLPSAGTPSEPLTVQEINEMLVSGSPEFEGTDEETRLDMLRGLLRDTMERTVSLELMEKQSDFAMELLGSGKHDEALVVALSIYDVASSVDNMNRALRDGLFALQEGKLGFGCAGMMLGAWRLVGDIYKEMGREEEVRPWFERVRDDMDRLIEGVASGADRAILMAHRDMDLNTGRPTGPLAQETQERIVEYLEEYLRKDGLTSEDRWGTSCVLAIGYEQAGRDEEALALYERLLTDAEAHGYSARSIPSRIDELKEKIADLVD